MEKAILKLSVVLLLVSAPLQGQVGINNTDPKSTLDISASSISAPSNTDGILIPRVNDFPSVDPGGNQNGMMIFLQNAVGLNDKGFYYWDHPNSRWFSIGAEEWKAGTNISGDNLIYATRAKLTGTDVVITDDGRIGFGTSDPIERFEFKGPGDNDFQITSANTNPPNLILYNTAGTLEEPLPLPLNQEIGSFIVKTFDGSRIREPGGVRFYIDSVAVSAGNVPTRFVVETTPVGSSSDVERLVIKNDGKTGIGTSEPTQTLDVNGSTRVRSLTAGPVYTDANGNLSNTGPAIVASGKVAYDGTAIKITGATVSKIGTGNYSITFSTSRDHSNYIIQLAYLECTGTGADCQGDNSINISYSSQSTSGFNVGIGSNDNGGTARVPRDREFMFTVIDF
ncbi:hypothetical protein [Aequorivita marisscotiae]|uniref:Uncharacterized protein n=1 Tax=Aequorivita marisscotiae TaxID=3040348 RepID=A0ABY8KTG7_9FLAO|nr:hypothetical protein [Aequorivita sp. Ant34-E75]WGF92342.1 hypothetical protein QCQ61_14175 [Aequorivita sp. Ant34-E75]